MKIFQLIFYLFESAKCIREKFSFLVLSQNVRTNFNPVQAPEIMSLEIMYFFFQITHKERYPTLTL